MKNKKWRIRTNFKKAPSGRGWGCPGFTLVELIVVITILAILATIGFVSFSGYLAGTRDTNRIAQLKSMSDALELYRTKKDLPIPDDKVDVKANSKVIAYQGDIGKNVLETIEYTESGLDPKYKEYFSYYLTKNKKYFQLMAFLEEENKDVKEEAFKAPDKGFGVFATDYSDKYPFVKGKKLGILTDTENNPIQKIDTITSSGYLDISDVGDTEYKAIIANDEIVSGTGTALASTNPIGSCKRIKQIKGGSSDGVYTIDPEANGTGFKVYCDMTTDGGGWTLVLNYLHKGGTNPNLLELTDKFPLKSNNNLGVDESGTKYWGHISRVLLNKINFEYIRFYGITSHHNRIMNFKTKSCNEYFLTGNGTCEGIKDNSILLNGHTTYLPEQANYHQNTSSFMTNHPFYKGGTYHWNIKTSGDRWEVDDYSINDNANTFHEIFVK